MLSGKPVRLKEIVLGGLPGRVLAKLRIAGGHGWSGKLEQGRFATAVTKSYLSM
jgi:hypothetical protein